MSHLDAELKRGIARNTELMRKARFEGREIDTRRLPDGRLGWMVPPDLVGKVGYMCAVVDE